MPSHSLAPRLLRALLLAVPIGFCLSGCASVRQSGALNRMQLNFDASCSNEHWKCREYHNALKKSRGEETPGLRLLREECEGSRYACAESIRQDQQSLAPTSFEEWRGPNGPK